MQLLILSPCHLVIGMLLRAESYAFRRPQPRYRPAPTSSGGIHTRPPTNRPGRFAAATIVPTANRITAGITGQALLWLNSARPRKNIDKKPSAKPHCTETPLVTSAKVTPTLRPARMAPGIIRP